MLHSAIMKYLYEINEIMIENGKNPILIIGNVRSNEVVNYFKFIDSEIVPETILCLSDEIRNKYVDCNKTPRHQHLEARHIMDKILFINQKAENYLCLIYPIHIEIKQTYKRSLRINQR